VSVQAIDQRVAALQDAQGTERLQLRGGAVHPHAGGVQGRNATCGEACVQHREATAVFGEAQRGMVPVQARFQLIEAKGTVAQTCGEGGFDTLGKVVEVLRTAAEGVLGPAQHGRGTQAVEALHRPQQLVAARALERATV
jgi:hypothetical protein